MEEKRTSVFENGLIWFGAAVSIAEILTGTYFAPLGFTKGLLAILIGHVIGCAMLFFAGLIGFIKAPSSREISLISTATDHGRYIHTFLIPSPRANVLENSPRGSWIWV